MKRPSAEESPPFPTASQGAPPRNTGSWVPAQACADLAQLGYERVEPLGGGGMGEVYKAFDPRLKRWVAIKQIRGDRVCKEGLARFHIEAEALARLAHPHIVQVYDFKETDAGPLLVMEYVAGGTLEQRLGNQPLAPAEAARLVAILAWAVHAAHEKGIVHRDLKPANVLLDEPVSGDSGNVLDGYPKVMDFGLAALAHESSGLTISGRLMGTPAYMAPEQAAGRVRAVGPASDVWALGVILYRGLTGALPFAGESVLDTLEQIRARRFLPLRARRPDVPARLEAVCLRCLAADPADRPTAAALAVALEGTSPVPPAPRPTRRRFWMLAGGILAAGVLALLGWASLPEGPASKDPVPLVPLKGYLDAEMTRPGDPLRQVVPLNDPAARPLRPGDEIRVRVELNRPAHVYLVWIDSEGQVTPMVPWIDGDWKRRGPETKAATFRLPQLNGTWGWWPMGPGKRGLETMVLLCRDEPLPMDVDLAALLGRFAPQPLAGQDAGAVMWFENGAAVRDEPQRAPLARPVEGGNPLERLNREVQRRAGGLFGYTRAITYGNEGDRP